MRPGFTIAPIVIRRSDILRLLDTESPERGTVFFDYFPDPSSGLGFRPGEELNLLKEGRYILRVVRDDLARRLNLLYPEK